MSEISLYCRNCYFWFWIVDLCNIVAILFTIKQTGMYFRAALLAYGRSTSRRKNITVWVCAGTAGVFALPFSSLGSACPFKSVSGSFAQEMNYYLSEGERKRRESEGRETGNVKAYSVKIEQSPLPVWEMGPGWWKRL